ncbi:DUF4832 domain-containing protein [Herbiconiux sp. P18]|uniref:DUF4832 domain-containing protein n=1 Tax=Herbiconiux liangxiaofengii TaxID=3342795 RepID=UPI0035BA7A95
MIAASGWTLVHGAADLSAYTGADGGTTVIDQAWLDGFAAALGHIRDVGMKVVLHFTYSPKVASGVETACDPNVKPADPNVPPDASLDTITAQLAQLRPIIDANLDIVSSIDAGFAGEWGEWHCSTNLLLSDANKPLLFEALFDGFPSSRQINFRYPQDIFDYLEKHPAHATRTANYQACYASGDGGGDVGTWPPNDTGAQLAMKTRLGQQIGEHQFIGLVVCNKPSANPDRLTCDTAVGPDGRSGEFALMHATYFDGTFDSTRFLPGYADCWSDLTDRLGYRLQLDSATLPTRLVPGADVPTSLTVTNTGFASVISERPAYLVISGAEHREAIRLSADARQWASMTTTVLNETVHIPDDLPVGDYDLSLWLPDPSTTLQARAGYAVQFANVGTWDAAGGLNVLASGLPASGAPASPTSSPGAGAGDPISSPGAALANTGADASSAASSAATAGITATGGLALLLLGLLVARRRRARS